jgi:hypothetical protein
MDGSATLTIDTSSTTMNCATHAMARITQSGTRRPLGVLAVPVPGSVVASSASDIGKVCLTGVSVRSRVAVQMASLSRRL